MVVSSSKHFYPNLICSKRKFIWSIKFSRMKSIQTISTSQRCLKITNDIIGVWKIQCKLPPKTKRFCPLVLK